MVGSDRQAPSRRRLTSRFSKAVRSRNYSDSITECIVAYEKLLVTPNAPFDRYLRGEADAVDSEVLEGYRLFKELGCAACHQGRNVGGNLFTQFGVMREYIHASPDGKATAEDGLVFSGDLDQRHIKVPTLRNVELTAPYFHDGSAETLDEAVAVMGVYQLGSELSEHDIERVVKFLRSLTGVLSEELK